MPSRKKSPSLVPDSSSKPAGNPQQTVVIASQSKYGFWQRQAQGLSERLRRIEADIQEYRAERIGAPRHDQAQINNAIDRLEHLASEQRKSLARFNAKILEHDGESTLAGTFVTA